MQCAIPCFEGLFPPSCEKVILDLLFILGTWHALTKLRMHSTSSHSLFERVTKTLGRIIRRFHDYVCPKYYTKDTPDEAAARLRRESIRTSKTSGNKDPSAEKKKVKSTKRNFSLKTYKLHALGHYPAMIARFGTSDSYSAQTVWYFRFFCSLTYLK